jgi:hypothetical protein
VKGESEAKAKMKEQIQDLSDLSVALDDYMIRINWLYFYWLPKQPLIAITEVDITSEREVLYQRVSQRDFEAAMVSAERLSGLMIKFQKGKVFGEVDTINNLAFCQINLNSFSKAREMLESVESKYALSRVNLASVLYFEGEMYDTRRILNKIVRKHIGKDHKIRFIHLALNHPNLPMSNRLAEDIFLFSSACWNLALIYAQQKEDDSIVNSFLKRVIPPDHGSLVHKRVLNWIKYYQGNISSALEDSRKLLANCEADSTLRDDVQKDIEIFQSEVSSV